MGLLAFAVLLAPVQDEPRIAALIHRLGSERFEERAGAAAELEKAGEAAIPLLKRALRAPDAEVKARAEALLKKFPADVLDRHPEAAREKLGPWDSELLAELQALAPARLPALLNDADARRRKWAMRLLAGGDRALPKERIADWIREFFQDGRGGKVPEGSLLDQLALVVRRAGGWNAAIRYAGRLIEESGEPKSAERLVGLAEETPMWDGVSLASRAFALDPKLLVPALDRWFESKAQGTLALLYVAGRTGMDLPPLYRCGDCTPEEVKAFHDAIQKAIARAKAWWMRNRDKAPADWDKP